MNTQAITASMNYLAEVLDTRLKQYFGKKAKYKHLGEIPSPVFTGEETPYTRFISENQLNLEEFIVLILALSPHVQPHLFDAHIAESIPSGGDFPQIGGVRGQQFRGFLPTGETALFLLAGESLDRRFEVMRMFKEEHMFAKAHVLGLEESLKEEPQMSGRLNMSQDYVDLFMTGHVASPKFSMNFPAKRISTKMDWQDLVLNTKTMAQVKELETWIKYGRVILDEWGMDKRIKPGFRALFYGPPGTGKTLTASLLGKFTDKEVYKVDLSMVVSKFIGETEKNLAKLFSKAENKGWILFFDEADSLFGKRTNVRDAHDKYANQEVSYLLQRVEDYDGLVILASNMKGNIDEAFMRRFQAVIHFPLPRPEERLQLWKKAIPEPVILDKSIKFNELAQRYELTGANIMNVIQYACLRSLEKHSKTIRMESILQGINREFVKEGKIV